mmetsp:Transcript_21861/g.36194  ORF Transcript_21861/g.36194 Transcript_21861/m.36194 type:complete len:469 (+) Transcript_21861:81-1487(+)
MLYINLFILVTLCTGPSLAASLNYSITVKEGIPLNLSSSVVGIGEWIHFPIKFEYNSSSEAPNGVSGVLIEMYRGDPGGDPVLFFKNDTIPTRKDLNLCADVDSASWFYSRHFLQRKNVSSTTPYYISVWNDPETTRLPKTNSSISISVRFEPQVPCLKECLGQCVDGRCFCGPEYAGEACEYSVPVLTSNIPFEASIPPGKWQYFSITVPSASPRYRLLLSIARKGGEPFLFAQPGTAPDIYTAVYEPWALHDENMFYVDTSRLSGPAPTVIYFGIINWNKNLEEDCNITIVGAFSAIEAGSLTMFTITIALSSICFVTCVLACCRMLWRRRMYASLEERGVGGTIGEFLLGPPYTPPNATERGTSRAVIDALPSYTYNGNDPNVPILDTECVICLSEFKEGEVLRRLPCAHKFHQPCIDRWLSNSHSCPLCKQDVSRPPSSIPAPQAASASSITIDISDSRARTNS